jgi:hypothetical protein
MSNRRHVPFDQRRIQVPGNGVPLIGQQQVPQAIGIVQHDAPFDTQCEAHLPGRDENNNQVLVKHLWGGKSKRLAIAAQLMDLDGLDIEDDDQIGRKCALAMKVASVLILMDGPVEEEAPPDTAPESGAQFGHAAQRAGL